MYTRSKELERQARAAFADLGEAELILIRAAADGTWADFRSASPSDNNPRKSALWGVNRRIRADLLQWLCCDPSVQRYLHFAGIKLCAAEVEGTLDLGSSNLHVPLLLARCAIAETIVLRSARTKYILLDGSCVGSIDADGAQIDGSLFLRARIKVENGVRLVGAEIRGDLDCSRALLTSKSGETLVADRAVIGGGFVLNHAIIVGIARLPGVRLGGNVDCARARLINPGNMVLNLERAVIGGNLSLIEGSRALGSVVIDQSNIGGSLVTVSSHLVSPRAIALSANFVKVDGGVFLTSRFEGTVRLRKANIGTELRCDGGQLLNPEGIALDAFGIQVGGSVQMRSSTGRSSLDFIAIGFVNLARAHISGDLDCRGANFINPDGCSILVDGALIKGGIFFNQNFLSAGQIRLIACDTSEVSCDRGIFIISSGAALSADRIRVSGNFSLSRGSLLRLA